MRLKHVLILVISVLAVGGLLGQGGEFGGPGSGASHKEGTGNPNTVGCSGIQCTCSRDGKDRFTDTSANEEWYCSDAATDTWTKYADTGGENKHVIEEDGTPLTARSAINFGAGIDCTDDAEGDETDCVSSINAAAANEAELEGDLSDVADVYTDNDGLLTDDNLGNDNIDALSDVHTDADAADDEILVGDGTYYRGLALPNCSSVQKLEYSQAGNSWSCVTDQTGSTTGTGSGGEHVTAVGAGTSGQCAEWDANGDLVAAGAACGVGGGGGAPTDARYLVDTLNATLTNEVLVNSEATLQSAILGGANVIVETEIDSAAKINTIITDGAIDDDDLTDDNISVLLNVDSTCNAEADELCIGNGSTLIGSTVTECTAAQKITYDDATQTFGCTTDANDGTGSYELGAGRQPNRVRFRKTSGSAGRVLAAGVSEAVKVGTGVTEDGDSEGYWAHETADSPAAITGMEFVYDDPNGQNRWYDCSYRYEITFNGATDQCGNMLFLNFTPDNAAVRWVSPFLYGSAGNKIDASAANVDHGQLPAGMQFMLSRMNVETASATSTGTIDFDWFEDDGTTNLSFGCQISGGGSTCQQTTNEGFTTGINNGLLLKVTPASTPTVSDTAVSICLGTPVDSDTVNNQGPIKYWHVMQKHTEDTHSTHTAAEDGQWAPLEITTQGQAVVRGSHTILMEDGLALQVIGYVEDHLSHGKDANYSVGYWEVSCNELPLTGTTTPFTEHLTANQTNFTAESRRFNGGVVTNKGATGALIHTIAGDTIQQGSSVTLVLEEAYDVSLNFGANTVLRLPEGTEVVNRCIHTTSAQKGEFITLFAESDGSLRVLGASGAWTETATCS
jgi:hypothetical protein